MFSFPATVYCGWEGSETIKHGHYKHRDAKHILVCLHLVYRTWEPCLTLWNSMTGKWPDLLLLCNLRSYQKISRIGVWVLLFPSTPNVWNFCLISFSQKHWVQWCNRIFSFSWSGSAGRHPQCALKHLKGFKILYDLRLQFVCCSGYSEPDFWRRSLPVPVLVSRTQPSHFCPSPSSFLLIGMWLLLLCLPPCRGLRPAPWTEPWTCGGWEMTSAQLVNTF